MFFFFMKLDSDFFYSLRTLVTNMFLRIKHHKNRFNTVYTNLKMCTTMFEFYKNIIGYINILRFKAKFF